MATISSSVSPFCDSHHVSCFFSAARLSSHEINCLEVKAFHVLTSLNRLQISHGKRRKNYGHLKVIAGTAGSHNSVPTNWWKQLFISRTANLPSLSEILWPSAGAFVSMAAMGLVDQMLSPRGLTLSIAPFGAVCVLLYAAPNAPSSQKYNVLIAHMGCALVGVLALAMFGPGWFARSVALSMSMVFMLSTGSFHPPAAGLPLVFIDGPKFHHLKWWYILFPGATGCILLFLVQVGVEALKEKYKF